MDLRLPLLILLFPLYYNNRQCTALLPAAASRHEALARYQFPSRAVLEREHQSCAELLEETLSEQVVAAQWARPMRKSRD